MTVFSTNMNVFTAPAVSPLSNDVISWAWLSEGQTEDVQRASLRREAAHALRQFKDAPHIASTYVDRKALLNRNVRLHRLRATIWASRAVMGADRVLLGASIPGADRLLWTAAYVTAKLLRKPIYVYSEVWLEPCGWRTWATKFVQRRLRKDAAYVLVPGDVHQEFAIRSGIPASRVVKIPSPYCPHPPRGSQAPRRLGGHREPPTMLYVGRLMPLKGLERLLRISDRLAALGESFRLLVVLPAADQYPGSDSSYAGRCRYLLAQQPRNRIEVLPHIDPIERIFSRADFLVMPHTVVVNDRVPAESWSRVAEEALFHGLFVVSTDAVPAAREFVIEGVNGRIVSWQSDAALEKAISQTLARVAANRASHRIGLRPST